MSRLKTPISLAMAVAFSGSVYAADPSQESYEEVTSGVAVSDVNAKLEIGVAHFDFGSQPNPAPGLFNFWDTSTAFVTEGAVSMPLSNRFGLQIDFGYLGSDVDLTAGAPVSSGDLRGLGAGAHLFWRDSTVGLLGLYGHFVDYDFSGVPGAVGSFTNTRLVVEGEKYLDNVTFRGSVGFDNLDTNNFGDESFLAASGEINYYHTDNLMFSAGVKHSFDQTNAVIGVEAMLDYGNYSPSFFAEAAFGDDVTAVGAGVRFYFGKQQKSLKMRHREDDPFTGLFDNAGLIGRCVGFALSGARMVEDRARSMDARVGYDDMGPAPRLDGCDINVNTGMMEPYDDEE